jgi:hypothetical protein
LLTTTGISEPRCLPETRYQKLALAVLIFGAFCFVYGVVREWKGPSFRPALRAPLELWLLLILTALNDSGSDISSTFPDAVCPGDLPSNFCHWSFGAVHPWRIETQNLASSRTGNLCRYIFRLDLSGHGETF